MGSQLFIATLGYGFSLASVMLGVAQLTFARGSAERLWNVWLSGTGRSASSGAPWVAPTVGGAVVGWTQTL